MDANRKTIASLNKEYNIGFYYQCYKQYAAADFALKSLRFSYPSATLLMINDGGDLKMKELALKYNANTYIYEENISSSQGLWYNTIDKCMKFIYRLKKAIDIIKEDYIFLMEDDVLILKKLKLDILVHEVNGCSLYEPIKDNVYKYIISCRTKPIDRPKLYVGGCGGCVLKRSFFVEILGDDNIDCVRKHLEQFLNLEKENGKPHLASDMIISFLAYIYDGDVIPYDGYIETTYQNYREICLSSTVIHNFKINYI